MWICDVLVCNSLIRICLGVLEGVFRRAFVGDGLVRRGRFGIERERQLDDFLAQRIIAGRFLQIGHGLLERVGGVGGRILGAARENRQTVTNRQKTKMQGFHKSICNLFSAR